MAASGWWMLSGLYRPGCADRQLLNTCWQLNIVTKGSQLSAHNISEVTRQTHIPLLRLHPCQGLEGAAAGCCSTSWLGTCLSTVPCSRAPGVVCMSCNDSA